MTTLSAIKAVAITHYRDAASTEAAMSKVAKHVVWHGPAGSPQNYDGWRSRHERLVHAFTDMEISVTNQIAEGDLVATQWTIKATHRGDFIGIAATGKRIVMSGMGIDRIADGLIVEHWGLQDMMGVAVQLGGKPIPEGPRVA